MTREEILKTIEEATLDLSVFTEDKSKEQIMKDVCNDLLQVLIKENQDNEVKRTGKAKISQMLKDIDWLEEKLGNIDDKTTALKEEYYDLQDSARQIRDSIKRKNENIAEIKSDIENIMKDRK